MDIERFVKQAKTSSPVDLLADKEFVRATHTRITLAALRHLQVFNRPYVRPEKNEFIQSHREHWSRFVHNLANWEQLSASLKLPRNERVLIAGWHFAELPTVFAFARKIRALMLVWQDAPWLESLKQAGCTLNFSEPGAIKTLIKEMQTGRVIGAMLDHAHPETRCEPARLLNRTVNTPSGILALCSRHGYEIVFIAPRPTGVEVVGRLDATGKSDRELAQQYNQWLEQEIRQAPATWLMWQAFPMR